MMIRLFLALLASAGLATAQVQAPRIVSDGAELVALTPSSALKLVILTNDLGMFRWDATSLAATNSSTVFKPLSLTTGRWIFATPGSVPGSDGTRIATNSGTGYKTSIRGGTHYLFTNYVETVAANTNLVIVGPYDTAASGSANFGATSGTSYEWLTYGHSYRIRQDGTVAQVKLYVPATTGLTGFYVSIWRKDGSAYDRIGTSANLQSSLSAGSVNTLSVSIPGAKEGDFIGGRLEWTSASAYNLFARTGVSAVTNYAVANAATTTNDFAWASQTATAGLVPVIECYMTAPVLVVIGDSIAAGHGTPSGDVEHYSFIETGDYTRIENSAPYWLAKANNWTYQNMGIGGQSLTNINARLAADVVALAPKYAVVHVGINDLTGSTTQSQFTNHWNYTLSTLTAAGITPVVSLMIGGDNTTDANDGFLDAYNSALVSLVQAAYPAAVIANAKPYLNTNAPNRSVVTNLYASAAGMTDDGTHPSPTGYRRLAQAWIDALSPPRTRERKGSSDIHLAGNGAVYAPSYSFEGSPKTGWFLNGSNAMSLTVAGTRKWDFDSSGNFRTAANGGANIGAAGGDSPAYIYAETQFTGPVGNNVTPPYSFLGYRSYGPYVEEAGPYLSLAVAAVPRVRYDTNGNWLFPSDGGGEIGKSGNDRPNRVWIKNRLSLGAVAGAVSSASDGDIWRDESAGVFAGRVNGTTVKFAASPGFTGSGSVVFSTSPSITSALLLSDTTIGNGGSFLWAVDGTGDLGASGSSRPGRVWIKDRLSLGAISGDVTAATDGDIWRDDLNGRFRGRVGGATVTFATSAAFTGSGSVVFGTSPTLSNPTLTGDTTIGSGGSLLWAVDGNANIGANAASRPNKIYVKDSIRFGAITGDISSASDGDFWRDDSNNRFRGRVGGANNSIISQSDATGAIKITGVASPTTATAGSIGMDVDLYGAGRGALQHFDGTADTILVGALKSDTPTNGQVPTWNTGGTVTWETPSGGGGTAVYVAGASVTNPNFSTTQFAVNAVTNVVIKSGAVVTNLDSTTPTVRTSITWDNGYTEKGASFVYQLADHALTNTTTFESSTNLTVAIAASTFYTFEARLLINWDMASSDPKVAMIFPASPTSVRYWTTVNNAPGATMLLPTGVASAGGTSHTVNTTGAGEGVFTITGFIFNGVNAGSITAQFANNVSGINILRAGSTLRVTRH